MHHAWPSPSMATGTLAFRRTGGQYVLAALRGGDRLDYGRLATGLAVRRSDLTSADLAEMGFLPGGVGPVAPRPGPRVVLDSAVLALPVVYCGAGRPDRTLEVAPPALVRAVAAAVFAFAR
jgi:Cys-tRNA(Pro)/Cys-tRNA(Cys) deacylase